MHLQQKLLAIYNVKHLLFILPAVLTQVVCIANAVLLFCVDTAIIE